MCIKHNMPEPKKTKIISEPRKGWNYLRLNFRVYLKKHYSCIKIQANWRGYNFRKKNGTRRAHHHSRPTSQSSDTDLLRGCSATRWHTMCDCVLAKKNVLEPCYINELDIDTQKLIEYLKDYLTEIRMEFYYKSSSTHNINLEDKYMEFLTAKCINGEQVGEGHCRIDVVKDDKGIDVLCVCLNGIQTNEKSIMQNFSKCGNNLDTLFDTCKYEEAFSLYRKEYYKKLFNAKKTKNIRKLYYLAFISTDVNVYMSVFKINLACILNMKYENITKQKKSINFKGFIDDKFGTTKLFKSKKRLEIRFNKDILNCYNTIQLI